MIYYFDDTLGDDGDEITVKCIIDGEVAGLVKYEKIYEVNSDRFVDDEERKLIGKNILDHYYPNNICIYLSYLEVSRKFQGKGIANILMERFLIDFEDQNFTDSIFINASPYVTATFTNKLPLDLLVKFYEKFGFIQLLDMGENVLMAYKRN